MWSVMVRTLQSVNRKQLKDIVCFIQRALAEVGCFGLPVGHVITYLSLLRLEFNFRAFAKALAPATPTSFPRKLSGQVRSLRCGDRLWGDTDVPPDGYELIWT